MSESHTPVTTIDEAIKLAYTAADQVKIEATDVVEYQSRGRVLVIGSAIDIARFGELSEPLTMNSLIVNRSEEAELEGALGSFSLNMQSSISKNLPAFQTDLVVDLCDTPLLSMAVPPPGYYYLGSNATNPVIIDETKKELIELVGTFEKPRYFNYDANKCAHGRSGQKGCTRCLDACPTEAITSLIDKITVDPYRCQGGGICATVCPSGAIQYSYPTPLNLLQRVRLMIKSFRESSGKSPSLVFCSHEAMPMAEQQFPKSLLLVVEESASVGLEVWFSALAWGAKHIVIFEPNEQPESSQSALQLQLETAQSLLTAIGYTKNTIELLQDTSPSEPPAATLSTPAKHAAVSDKRQAFYMAIDYLLEQIPPTTEIVDLPESAIFGSIDVDKEACTLCMSCVSACPANALQDGRELPQLGFIESKCLQCSVCVNTCPENALSITPRFVLNKSDRTRVQILNEESPFCCITCGKPFATQS
ncbi:MAG: Iron-sulfur cluster-binding protein, partial [uncultured Thiotrichaceae bacterium]